MDMAKWQVAPRGHRLGGTWIRDVFLGTERLTEGVLGIRRTAPKVSVHLPSKGTLGIRSVAPELVPVMPRNNCFGTGEQVVFS